MNEETVKRELQTLIESSVIQLKEFNRVWSSKEDISEYERGRAEGVIISGKDFIDNLMRFRERVLTDGTTPKTKEKSQ